MSLVGGIGSGVSGDSSKLVMTELLHSPTGCSKSGGTLKT